MAYELKVNTGTLHHSKVKKHPKAPDYFGEILIDLNGLEVKNNKVTVKLGGWKTTTDKGTTYLFLKVDTYKRDEQESQAKPEQDEDIPF